ncbi:MAG: ATP-binding protein [Planctomycetota bacterium]
MPNEVRVTKEKLARDLMSRLKIPLSESVRLLDKVFEAMREHLRDGSVVEIDDLLSLSISGQPEIREDDSGGFSAFAPEVKTLSAQPIGSFATHLEKTRAAAIYYLSTGNEQFATFLRDHFGRRGWRVIASTSSLELVESIENDPPIAVLAEARTEGAWDLVREIKCNPRTNGVPVVVIQGADDADEPAREVRVEPDEIVKEPFDMHEFIQTAGNELVARVANPMKDVVEVQMTLPGNERQRKRARQIIDEMLFRCHLPESFISDVGGALREALDNAFRHGHKSVDCCTIDVRMILDPRRLVVAVRDTGDGFDQAAALAAARGSQKGNSHLARAAAALRTRRGDAADGGVARMLELMDRIEFNQRGNEVVLTKTRPE